jgi:hypothetical protein
MRRWALLVGLAVAIAFAALAQGSIPQPVYFWPSMAQPIVSPFSGKQTRVIKPATLYMFADGSWVIDDLHWTSWGGATAKATGTSSSSTGNPSAAQGSRINDPATVTLSNPGRFNGYEAYRCLTLRVPAYPRSDEALCLKNSGHGEWDMAFVPPPKPKPSEIDFYASSAGSCYMTRTVTRCETQRPPTVRTATLNTKSAVAICTQRVPINAIWVPTCPVSNPGLHTPTYRPNKTIRFGTFQCQVLKAGVKCVVAKTGKGFLMSTTRAVRVR